METWPRARWGRLLSHTVGGGRGGLGRGSGRLDRSGGRGSLRQRREDLARARRRMAAHEAWEAAEPHCRRRPPLKRGLVASRLTEPHLPAETHTAEGHLPAVRGPGRRGGGRAGRDEETVSFFKHACS